MLHFRQFIAKASKRVSRAILKIALAFCIVLPCSADSFTLDDIYDILDTIDMDIYSGNGYLVDIAATLYDEIRSDVYDISESTFANGETLDSILVKLNLLQSISTTQSSILSNLQSIYGLSDSMYDVLVNMADNQTSTTGLATEQTLVGTSDKLDQILDAIGSVGGNGSSFPSEDEDLMEVLGQILVKIPTSLTFNGNIVADVQFPDDISLNLDFSWTPLLEVIQNQFQIADGISGESFSMTSINWAKLKNKLGKDSPTEKISDNQVSVSFGTGQWISGLLAYQQRILKESIEQNWGLLEIASYLAPTGTEEFVEESKQTISDITDSSEVEDFDASNVVSSVSFEPLSSARKFLIDAYEVKTITSYDLPSSITLSLPPFLNFETQSIVVYTTDIVEYLSAVRVVFRLVYWALLLWLLILMFRFALFSYNVINKVLTGQGSPNTKG